MIRTSLMFLAIALLVAVAIAVHDHERGVVGDGMVREVSADRVCFRGFPPPNRANASGQPPGPEIRQLSKGRCYNIPPGADVEDSIEKHDIVRVRRIEGKVVSVESLPLED